MIILITGVPRSGSTYLFNFLRIFLIHIFGLSKIDYGYFRPLPNPIPKNKIFLFKLHNYCKNKIDDLRKQTDIFVIHSSRDATDAHESYKKFSAKWKKPVEYSVERIQKLDAEWKSICDECLLYEELRLPDHKERLIQVIEKLLNIIFSQGFTPANESIEIDLLWKKLDELENPLEFNDLTLMYPDHKQTSFTVVK